jgi:hypothetical protein
VRNYNIQGASTIAKQFSHLFFNFQGTKEEFLKAKGDSLESVSIQRLLHLLNIAISITNITPFSSASNEEECPKLTTKQPTRGSKISKDTPTRG